MVLTETTSHKHNKKQTKILKKLLLIELIVWRNKINVHCPRNKKLYYHITSSVMETLRSKSLRDTGENANKHESFLASLSLLLLVGSSFFVYNSSQAAAARHFTQHSFLSTFSPLLLFSCVCTPLGRSNSARQKSADSSVLVWFFPLYPLSVFISFSYSIY